MNYKNFIETCNDKEAVKTVNNLVKDFKLNKDSLEIINGTKRGCIQNYRVSSNKGILDFHTILN